MKLQLAKAASSTAGVMPGCWVVSFKEVAAASQLNFVRWAGVMDVTVEQAEAVASLVWPEVVEEGGAVFLRSARLATSAPLDTFADLVEAECLVNHVHMLDEFRHHASLDEEPFWNVTHDDFRGAVALAAVIADCWAARLAACFPTRDFAVFATRDDDPIVRFHQVLSGSALWLDLNRLDQLGPGAALVILVEKGRVTRRLGSIEARP